MTQWRYDRSAATNTQHSRTEWHRIATDQTGRHSTLACSSCCRLDTFRICRLRQFRRNVSVWMPEDRGVWKGRTRGTCPPSKLPRWKFFLSNQYGICDIQSKFQHIFRFLGLCLRPQPGLCPCMDPTGEWWRNPLFCPLWNKFLATPLREENVYVSPRITGKYQPGETSSRPWFLATVATNPVSICKKANGKCEETTSLELGDSRHVVGRYNFIVPTALFVGSSDAGAWTESQQRVQTHRPSLKSLSTQTNLIYTQLTRRNMALRLWTPLLFRITTNLTLWRPLLPYGYSYKASCARPG